MKVKILLSGIKDIEAGKDFYDSQDKGVGGYFLETIFSEIESLRLHGGIHKKVFGYFRLLARKFPYAIYYIIDENVVVVYRIIDCRRDPKFHRKSLQK